MTSTEQLSNADGVTAESEVARRATQLQLVVTAVCFLTRIPFGARAASASRDALSRCVIYFPLVGTLVGTITACITVGAVQLWPVWIAVILALAFEAMLTGAFHEDALADFFDGMGGGWTRDDVLRIMKDSRLGTYGAVALLLGVACRAATIVTLVLSYEAAEWYVWAAVVVASATVGRFAILPLMGLLPPTGDSSSLARDIGERTSFSQVVSGAMFTAPAAGAMAWLLPLQMAIAAGLVLVAGVFFAWYVRRRLGGVTGDCLGCFCYLSQLLVLLAATVKMS